MTFIWQKLQPWLIAALTIGLTLASVMPAAAQPSPPPGLTRGFDTYFEVTNSDWLNVTVSSTTPINLTLTSIPTIVTLNIAAAKSGPTFRRPSPSAG